MTAMAPDRRLGDNSVLNERPEPQSQCKILGVLGES
jgi:hypothetical protein